MGARGNKLSSCKIPDQYLTKQKKSSDNFGLKKKEKR